MKGIVCFGKTGRTFIFVGGKRAEGGVSDWAAVLAAEGAPRREDVSARNIVEEEVKVVLQWWWRDGWRIAIGIFLAECSGSLSARRCYELIEMQ